MDWDVDVLEDDSIVETYVGPGPMVVSRRILMERVSYAHLKVEDATMVLVGLGGWDVDAGEDVERADGALAVGVAMTPAAARDVARRLREWADAAESV